MKIVQDNAFSSLDAGTWPTVPPRNLPGLLRRRSARCYASALSEHIPDELARCLTRLSAEPKPLAAEIGSVGFV